MQPFSFWQGALADAWGQVWSSFLVLLPKILGGVVVFAVGLILAFWVKKLLMGFFRLVKLERVTKPMGIDGYLSKADIKFTFNELIATVFEWIVILVFFLAVVDILGLSVVSQVVASVLGYIPNVIAAALILGAGVIVAGLVDGLVRGAITSLDKSIARSVGKLARYLVVVVTFFAAIDQLQIAQGLIATFFQGLTYTLVLVIGLAVGLGSKDLVAKILGDWYDKIRK
ncbi:hypothetical protein ACFL1Q_03015 [Patescibacteria group bacterium]